jgi:hypothetical protein
LPPGSRFSLKDESSGTRKASSMIEIADLWVSGDPRVWDDALQRYNTPFPSTGMEKPSKTDEADLAVAAQTSKGKAGNEGEAMIRAALRFPIADLDKWASECNAQDDLRAQSAADTAKERSSMTKEEFLTVTTWKSPRPKRWLEKNTADDIKDATHSAFSTTNARVRIATSAAESKSDPAKGLEVWS